MKALEHTCGDRAIVRVQSPVGLSPDSAPEPDVAVLAPEGDFYETELPSAEDVYLAVETSLSSLGYDRSTKLSIYARAGVPEVWIVNVDEGQLEVHREPQNGFYRVRLLLRLGEPVTPAAVPDALQIVF